MKKDTYEEFLNEYKKIISKLYSKYEFLLKSDKIIEPFKIIFKDYYYMRTDDLAGAILDLMVMLKE